MKERMKSMIYVSLGAVFITVCSWITVPFAIPFTMQTFGIFFVLKAFGGKIGGLSIFLHTAMGFIGLPVFSGFNSGISALLSPTGGYIIGFLLTGTIYFALQSIFNKNRIIRVAVPYVSLVVCYVLGTVWYMQYISAESEIGLVSALSICVFPYIIPDVLKITLAGISAEKLKKSNQALR